MADDHAYFDLENILDKTVEAVTASSRHLADIFREERWRDFPFVYTIPKFTVSVAVTLSYKDGKILAFFQKSAEATTESRITFDVVAVPHANR